MKLPFLFLFLLLFPGLTLANSAPSWQWTTPTPGEENTLSTTTSLQETGDAPKTVIISEIFPNPKGKDGEKEWVELELMAQNTSLSSLVLSLGEKTYPLPVQTTTGPFVLFSLPSSFALPNTTGTLILQTTEGTILDQFSYTSTEEEHTISRFCDPAFPTLCTYEHSTATPGKPNLPLPLSITASPTKTEPTRPFTLSLKGNTKDMRIFYTFSPESANPEEAREYTAPIPIKESSTIYYFGYRSLTERTPIESLTFTFPTKTTALFINEVHPEAGWVELKSTGKPQKLTGYELTSTPELPTCPSESCLALNGEITTFYLQEGISFLSPLPETLTLRTAKGKEIDQLTFTPSLGKSFARTASAFQDFLEQEYLFSELIGFQKASYLWTDLPTKAKDNVILKYLSETEDQDRDFLSDRQEPSRAFSNTTQYSDKSLIPDTVKWQFSSASSEQHMDRWKTLLTAITQIEEDGYTMHSYPLSSLRITGEEKDILEEVTADAFGIAQHTTPPTQNLYLEYPRTELILPFPHNRPKLRIQEIMPNPQGKDQSTNEYVIFQNNDRVPLTLSDFTLQINQKSIALPQKSIAPGASLTLIGKDLGTTLPNTETTLLLSFKDEVLEELSYQKAEEGKALRNSGREGNAALPTSNNSEDEIQEPSSSEEHAQENEPALSPTPESTAPIPTSPNLPTTQKSKADLIWSILWSTLLMGNGFFFFPR